jgi:hypothetical protein
MQEEDLRRPPLELPNLKDIKHLVYSINYLRFMTLEGSSVADPNPDPLVSGTDPDPSIIIQK